MATLYPLRFVPVFRRYVWGGRRLGKILGKPIGLGNDYAESWEVVDHGEDQSRVAAGALAGTTLNEVTNLYGKELLGRHYPQPRFPLLFKFLDCDKTLSVQVHPNDQQAAKLDPPDAGKTEAWVVLAAEPGSVIYAGLKRGFDRAALERRSCAALANSVCIALSPSRATACFAGGRDSRLGRGTDDRRDSASQRRHVPNL